jgi:GMP synthase-like glutamine amidotransferase
MAAGLDYTIYDCRVENQYPKLEDHDIFISSGGPGDPNEVSFTDWGANYKNWLNSLMAHNSRSNSKKKYAFLICHSFQMACIHFNLGEVTKRKSTSFGIFPVHMTNEGCEDHAMTNLPDPFYVVDSRDYQVVRPALENILEMGAVMLAKEKYRPHIPLERAVMAIRFSPEIFGTQFHPEADPQSLRFHLTDSKRTAEIVETYGQDKLDWMRESVDDPDKIIHTYNVMLPEFLLAAVNNLEVAVSVVA